jgi:hypothetical protein
MKLSLAFPILMLLKLRLSWAQVLPVCNSHSFCSTDENRSKTDNQITTRMTSRRHTRQLMTSLLTFALERGLRSPISAPSQQWVLISAPSQQWVLISAPSQQWVLMEKVSE